MKKRIVEDTSVFFEVLGNTPQESKNYVTKSMEIVHEIMLLLKEKDMNQKKLAQKLGKTEAEVSKWLSGTHNFTVRTLTFIETAIGEEIIVTPHKVRNNALKYTTAIYRASVNEKKSILHKAEKYKIKSKSERFELSAA
jgi:transcriptional regulator with XRE-family HTH domain